MVGFLAFEFPSLRYSIAGAVPVGANFAPKSAKCRDFKADERFGIEVVAPAVLTRPL
jgi:hypothetical protein